MKNVIVTGGSGGIGQAVCRVAAQKGYAVSAFDRSPAPDLHDKLQADGLTSRFYEVDVTERSQIDAAVAAAEQEFGPIWGLVNCAGVAPEIPFEGTDEDVLDQTYRVNVRGSFSCIKAVTGGMIDRGDGRIVNITSTSATFGFAMLSAYDASKGALAALTRTLAVELGHTGIRVNAVSPGTIVTELSEEWLKRERVAGHEADRIPVGRFGKPEDIAKAVSFLLDPETEWVNGTTITVDGGHSITGLPFFEELRSA